MTTRLDSPRRTRRWAGALMLGAALTFLPAAPALAALTCTQPSHRVFVYSNISGATIQRLHFWSSPLASTYGSMNGFWENNTNRQTVHGYGTATNGTGGSSGMYCKPPGIS